MKVRFDTHSNIHMYVFMYICICIRIHVKASLNYFTYVMLTTQYVNQVYA